jgi:tripeptidyl-peptidase I
LTPVVKRNINVRRRSSELEKRNSHLAYSQQPNSGFSLHWKPPSADKLPADVQGCGTNITPPCIRALYQIPQLQHATPGNSLGLFEQGSYFNEDDVNAFYAEYAPYVPQGTFPIPALIDGANYSVPAYSSLDSGEADIDIDMAYVKLR